jgi:transposase
MTDAALEALLFPPPANVPKDKRPLPHWPTLYAELKRPGVTLHLLWEEHRAAYPDSYGYSRVCELYRAWEGRLTPTSRVDSAAE